MGRKKNAELTDKPVNVRLSIEGYQGIKEIARREGVFGIDDVVAGIVDKLVHRHPHVFGDLSVADADEVLKNWELLKAKEKVGRGLLGGVPKSLRLATRARWRAVG